MAPRIGLIVTGNQALEELRIFTKTLEMWHPDAILYIYTDSDTDISSIKFKGTIHCMVQLDDYLGKRRYEMESLPGKRYNTLFKDYTFEKANVLEWIFEREQPDGVWFLDVDICFLAPLPSIPSTKTLALCPHYIRESDAAKFGFYNAGFLWMKDPTYIAHWRAAGVRSRFYEQAALEDIAQLAKQEDALYEFPIQVNFGWWRMFQASDDPNVIQSKFSIFRQDASIGVRYDGQALQSIHTHWNNQGEYALQAFNTWFRLFLKKVESHAPAKTFRSAIR